MLDAYLDYSYYLVYIFYFEILEEKNHDFFENWELMIHARIRNKVLETRQGVLMTFYGAQKCLPQAKIQLLYPVMLKLEN